MSRLSIETPGRAQTVLGGLQRDMERRISASQPGLCSVDMSLNFLRLCHAQTCGMRPSCPGACGRLGPLPSPCITTTTSVSSVCAASRYATRSNP